MMCLYSAGDPPPIPETNRSADLICLWLPNYVRHMSCPLLAFTTTARYHGGLYTIEASNRR